MQRFCRSDNTASREWGIRVGKSLWVARIFRSASEVPWDTCNTPPHPVMYEVCGRRTNVTMAGEPLADGPEFDLSERDADALLSFFLGGQRAETG